MDERGRMDLNEYQSMVMEMHGNKRDSSTQWDLDIDTHIYIYIYGSNVDKRRFKI